MSAYYRTVYKKNWQLCLTRERLFEQTEWADPRNWRD